MAEQIPVYLFTGFLEAGKTKFIQETMEDPRFNEGGTHPAADLRGGARGIFPRQLYK